MDGPDKERDYCILTLFLNCGMRLSELVSINMSDVIHNNSTLRIVGKGSKERIVYLNDACLASIDAYVRVRPKDDVKDKNALFISRNRNRISVQTVKWLVKKYVGQAGLNTHKYSAHKLRHTAATLMVANGVDLRTVQEVLGHEHLNTTEIYTHIENTELKIAAEANPLSRPAPKETHYEKDPVI